MVRTTEWALQPGKHWWNRRHSTLHQRMPLFGPLLSFGLISANLCNATTAMQDRYASCPSIMPTHASAEGRQGVVPLSISIKVPQQAR